MLSRWFTFVVWSRKNVIFGFFLFFLQISLVKKRGGDHGRLPVAVIPVLILLTLGGKPTRGRQESQFCWFTFYKGCFNCRAVRGGAVGQKFWYGASWNRALFRVFSQLGSTESRSAREAFPIKPSRKTSALLTIRHNSRWLKAVKYLSKKLHLRCLTGFWIRLWGLTFCSCFLCGLLSEDVNVRSDFPSLTVLTSVSCLTSNDHFFKVKSKVYLVQKTITFTRSSSDSLDSNVEVISGLCEDAIAVQIRKKTR